MLESTWLATLHQAKNAFADIRVFPRHTDNLWAEAMS